MKRSTGWYIGMCPTEALFWWYTNCTRALQRYLPTLMCLLSAAWHRPLTECIPLELTLQRVSSRATARTAEKHTQRESERGGRV